MADYFTSNAPGSVVSVHVEGVREAVEVLKKLEFAARRRVVSAAVRAANAVIVKTARSLAPVGKTGLLKKQIRGSVKFQPGSGVVWGDIRSHATKAQRKRGGPNAGKYAHLVIGGTRPHSIEKGATGAMLALPSGFYSRVMHPGARPRPFMDQAANAAFREAINAFGWKMDQALAKEIEKVKQLGATRQALDVIRARF